MSKDLTRCGKNLSPDAVLALAERYEGARVRAQTLAAKHGGDGSGQLANPRSNLWELVDSIRGAGI